MEKRFPSSHSKLSGPRKAGHVCCPLIPLLLLFALFSQLILIDGSWWKLDFLSFYMIDRCEHCGWSQARSSNLLLPLSLSFSLLLSSNVTSWGGRRIRHVILSFNRSFGFWTRKRTTTDCARPRTNLFSSPAPPTRATTVAWMNLFWVNYHHHDTRMSTRDCYRKEGWMISRAASGVQKRPPAFHHEWTRALPRAVVHTTKPSTCISPNTYTHTLHWSDFFLFTFRFSWWGQDRDLRSGWQHDKKTFARNWFVFNLDMMIDHLLGCHLVLNYQYLLAYVKRQLIGSNMWTLNQPKSCRAVPNSRHLDIWSPTSHYEFMKAAKSNSDALHAIMKVFKYSYTHKVKVNKPWLFVMSSTPILL